MKLELGNLDACRDCCYTKDAVYAMWLMLQQAQPDDYIIPSSETHSVKGLVECANCVCLNWHYVSVDSAFYRPDESVQLVGFINKIKTELGCEP
ncbi:hypothetical protein GTQ43_13505 [Nostoc sp. KVJ3]|nr:hypothetical protein [Nostoc sp. KVJ3]